MGAHLVEYLQQARKNVEKILKIASKERKSTGFCIGNTAKIGSHSLYFTPVRNTSVMVVGGVIVYSCRQAIDIAEVVDGRVEYVLVDAEKKVADEMSLTGEPANVERSVRETLKKSKLWIYKGNDLAVEAVDALLTHLTKKSPKGLGGKKVAILGAGNLGAKLALRLVERAAHVVITRRNGEALEAITKAFNYIKPTYTRAKVAGTTSNEYAARGAEILIGATRGTPVITREMVSHLMDDAIIVDAGKGVLYPDAIIAAEERKIDIYRLDVSGAFEGLVHKLWATETIVEKRMGRRQFCQEVLVSGGLLGRKNEIVVDNVWNPTAVYGIADGRGDFVRDLSKEHIRRIERLQNLIGDL